MTLCEADWVTGCGRMSSLIRQIECWVQCKRGFLSLMLILIVLALIVVGAIWLISRKKKR